MRLYEGYFYISLIALIFYIKIVLFVFWDISKKKLFFSTRFNTSPLSKINRVVTKGFQQPEEVVIIIIQLMMSKYRACAGVMRKGLLACWPLSPCCPRSCYQKDRLLLISRAIALLPTDIPVLPAANWSGCQFRPLC